ncbi:hemolysin family protein [soil metagenome]
MDLTAIPILLALPFLLAVAAWAATVETALFSLTYPDRARLRKLSPRAAEATAYLLARPRATLITILFFNMIATTLYLVLTALLETHVSSSVIHWAIVAFNLLLMTIVAEVVSKLLAARLRVEVCRRFATSALFLFRILGPLRVFLDTVVISPLVRLFAPAGETDAAQRLTDDELTSLIALGRQEGAIDSSEVAVLRQVIGFGQLRVKEVMTPRVDMEWLGDDATAAQVGELAARTRITRLPITVAGGEPDDGVVGLLNVKKFLAEAELKRAAPLASYCEPAVFVPASAPLDLLLEHFRAQRLKLALCVDEYGSIVGAVAVADIARRLMAELAQGSAPSDPDSRIQMVALGAWSVPGRLPVRDWAAMFGLANQRRVSTIAGLIMDRLGRLPRVGDRVLLGNVALEVEAVSGRVVDRVIVSLVHTPILTAPGPLTAEAPRGT